MTQIPARQRVAVCICTANRPATLARLLAHLQRAELPPAGRELMLVVVNNRPGHTVADDFAGLCDALPVPVILDEEPTAGIPFARNRAVATALHHGADLVAFIDDDDLPRPDWLVRLLATHDRTGADLVFGSQRPSPEMCVPDWLQRVKLFEPKPLPRHNGYGIPGGASTCNVLLSRALLLAMLAEGPLFRPQFIGSGGSDTDLFIRAARRGFRFTVSTESEVWLTWEPERLTWRGLTRRSFRYGVTRWRLREAHGEPRPRSAELRRCCKAMARKSVQLVKALPGRRRFARTYFQLVEQAGEMHALLGGRFAYYDRQAPGRRTAPP